MFQRNGTMENTDARVFVVGCALLTLTLGVGFRAIQIREFISDDLAQMPAYAGTERRIVMVDPTFAFYGADLVQNDPFLRGNEIRMVSHTAAENSALIRRYYPEMHRVYADRYGSVWSSAPASTATAAH